MTPPPLALAPVDEPLPWRRLALLAALVALLAPATWVSVSRRLASPASKPESPLVDFVASEVRSIDVSGEGRAGRFERLGGVWTLSVPGSPSRPVDGELVEGFLGTLAGLGRLTQFVDPDLAAFGLAEPRGTFTLGLDPEVQMAIGDRNPPLTALYVRRGASPEIEMVGSVLLWEWDKLLGELRRVPEAPEKSGSPGPDR